MRLKFFSIPVAPAVPDASSTEELNAFLAQRRVLAVERQFVADGSASFWSVCVTYQPTQAKPTGSKKGSIDYKEVLSPKDFAVFSELRNLRKDEAEREEVPAYALFTNEQLACMVRQRVTTRAALLKIDGVGEVRAGKYGDMFLATLRRVFAAGAGQPTATSAKAPPAKATDEKAAHGGPTGDKAAEGEIAAD